MDIPAKKLVRLMQATDPALRAAALLVFAELGVKDAEANAEVLTALHDKDGDVRHNAIRAAGKLKLAKAMPILLERIKVGGAESNDAAEAAAQLGAEGVKGLQATMSQVAPGLRRYIAAALTGAGSAGAEAGVKVLLDSDPQVAGAAASAIIGRIPTMPAEQKKALAKELLTLATDRKKKLPPKAEMPLIRIFASLNDPSVADALWERTQPPYLHEVRAAALGAVGGWVQTATKDQWKKLFACAAETDFQILAPALTILGKLPFSEKQATEWMNLLHAPDLAARRLAMEKLGDRDTPEYAAALMEQLTHVDRGLRDSARATLANIEHGRQALVKALLTVESNDELWQLARLVAPFAKSFPAKLRTDIRNRGLKYLEADDHRVDPLFFLLRETDAAGFRDELLELAVAKRKKKDHQAAVKYLKFLGRDPAVGLPVRLELALNGLKLSSKEIPAEFRVNDPCLRQFSHILEQKAAEVEAQVAKAKWLEAEDLFYLGFHFAEQAAIPEKTFGAAVLTQLIKTFPKSKVTPGAKNKLKTVVLK